jgi:spermidine synthase
MNLASNELALSRRAAGSVRMRSLLPSYAATLFLSAALLFLVQPMLTKMVLPQLGGAPSVWNTCLCFFQATLLLGYLYAHLSATRLGPRAQLGTHLLVLALAALFLPLDPTGGATPSSGAPVLWLLSRLAATAGIPFFAISATAPLLQRWFSRTDHATARDPYFLYAASNAGSLSALLSYPLLVEPSLPLVEQSRAWSAGLGVLVGGIALCWLGYRSSEVAARPEATLAGSVTMGDRLQWIAYSFVPSGLLLAVTGYIATDLASAPLFWVVPLSLYLMTFILVFARHPPLPHWWMIKLQPLIVILLVVLSPTSHNIWLLGFHPAGFFVIAMVCHGELAARRPPVENLTEFYLCVSLGGVLGGLFIALVAPIIFPDIWEYPVMIAASCLLRPATSGGGAGALRRDILLPGLLFVLLTGLLYLDQVPAPALIAALVLTALALLRFSERRWRFALGVSACLLVVQLAASQGTLETRRSFFGVYRVRLVDEGRIRVLQHGTTVHGAASAEPGQETVPLAYYSRDGAFGRFFAALAARPVRRVGVIGLGTGSLGCYARPGQSWVFHEIDPVDERIARDDRFFHFLAECGESPRIVLGDARLTLQLVPDRFYDVLVIDAFSSDSIPVHLLTREALALYHKKLAPAGVMLFHISNRYLELTPVLAALAADAGAPARHLRDRPAGPDSTAHFQTEVVAVGAIGGNLDFLTADFGWEPMPLALRSALWTDQRSDIVSRIK